MLYIASPDMIFLCNCQLCVLGLFCLACSGSPILLKTAGLFKKFFYSWIMLHHVRIPQFLQLYANGHSGGFQILAAVDNAAMNMRAEIPLKAVGHVSSRTALALHSFIFSLWGTSQLLPIMPCEFTLPPAVCKSSFFLHSHVHMCYLLSFWLWQ